MNKLQVIWLVAAVSYLCCALYAIGEDEPALALSFLCASFASLFFYYETE